MVNKALKIALITLSVVSAFLIFAKVELVHRGGPVMIPVLFVSIFAFAIVWAKLKQFSKYTIDVENLMKNIFERMERQRIKEAIDLCDHTPVPLARILRAGIMKYDRPKDEIKEAMEDALLYEMPLLEENLSILSTIIQIAPLLGILGTLVGLIKIFQVIQARSAAFVPIATADLTPGIWEALICSAAGFLVAIPLLIASNYLASRVRSFVDEVERAATELVAFYMERRMPT